jgi:hypothetical protein
MKAHFYITTIVVFFLFVGTSCRKERTCECKTTTTIVTTGFGAGTETYQTSSKVTMAKQKKNNFKATSACYSYKTVDTDNGGTGPSAYTEVKTVEETCELK